MENNARKCSYDPFADMVILDKDTESPKSYLLVKNRLQWFHTWCAENASVVTAKIETAVVSELTSDKKITMNAKIIINNDVFSGFGSVSLDDEANFGSELETAETRAIGRALSHAGFGSPNETDDEKNPCEGAGKQDVTEAPKAAKAEPSAKQADTTETKKIEPDERQALINQVVLDLKKDYPYNPFQNQQVLSVAANPKFKESLQWIVTTCKGNSKSVVENKALAERLLKYVYPKNDEDKLIYLEVRKILKAEGLIK